MTKRYSTTYPNGYVDETSNPHEAYNFRNNFEGQEFRLRGVVVPASQFFEEAKKHADELWEKKNTTHKQISVQHGVTPFARVTVWVRR